MSIANANFAIFNGSNLASLVSGLTVLAINPYRPAKRNLNIANLARVNKRKVPSAFYREKDIAVTVCIQQANRDAVERSIDSLMALLQGIEKELMVPQSGGTRKYVCTYSDAVPRKDGGAYWEADLVFALSDLMGSDTSYTTIVSLTGVTSATRSDQYNFEGSAPWQLPRIEIYYTAITGGTAADVVIGNATGSSMTINRTWAAGDRLVIDCANESVQVNGANVAFTGGFPNFPRGVGTLQYSDGFTTRTYNNTTTYYRRWV